MPDAPPLVLSPEALQSLAEDLPEPCRSAFEAIARAASNHPAVMGQASMAVAALLARRFGMTSGWFVGMAEAAFDDVGRAADERVEAQVDAAPPVDGEFLNLVIPNNLKPALAALSSAHLAHRDDVAGLVEIYTALQWLTAAVAMSMGKGPDILARDAGDAMAEIADMWREIRSGDAVPEKSAVH